MYPSFFSGIRNIKIYLEINLRFINYNWIHNKLKVMEILVWKDSNPCNFRNPQGTAYSPQYFLLKSLFFSEVASVFFLIAMTIYQFVSTKAALALLLLPNVDYGGHQVNSSQLKSTPISVLHLSPLWLLPQSMLTSPQKCEQWQTARESRRNISTEISFEGIQPPLSRVTPLPLRTLSIVESKHLFPLESTLWICSGFCTGSFK